VLNLPGVDLDSGRDFPPDVAAATNSAVVNALQVPFPRDVVHVSTTRSHCRTVVD